MNLKKRFGNDAQILWKDRKRYFGMPLSFTRYFIIKKDLLWTKLFTSIGWLSTREEEVQAFRIFDISVYQSLINKIFRVGTITLYCNDESHTEINLIRVKNPLKVRDMLANIIEENRRQKKLQVAEFYS